LTQGIKEAAQTATRAVKAQASEFTTDVGHAGIRNAWDMTMWIVIRVPVAPVEKNSAS
jgi:hypothetical protein